MPSTLSTVSTPNRAILDRRQRHQRASGSADAIPFRTRAGEPGVAFTDDIPTAELAPCQPLVSQVAPVDERTDPWPRSAAAADAAAGVSAPQRPDKATGDLPGPLIPEIAAGSVLGGRYALDRIIGQGGHSSVFLARDLRRAPEARGGKNFVALKLLHAAQRSNPHALIRLKREYRQTQSLLHPGIVQVFDLDCEGDVWFMAMELVAGETASSWLRKGVSHADAMKVIRACCTALDHAHSKGILHGDLKPSNVLVLKDGAVKLIDFGSAAAASDLADVGSDDSVGVTPSYASREVLLGQGIEQRDDVFSLAVLCYAILSGGGHPFDRKTAIEAAREHMAPIPVATIPERLFAVISRGLAMERASRPASVREFLHELRRASKPLAAALEPDPVDEALLRAFVMSRPTVSQHLRTAVRPDRFTAPRHRHALVGWSLALVGIVVPVQSSMEQSSVRAPVMPQVILTQAAAPLLAAAAVTSASVSPAASYASLQAAPVADVAFSGRDLDSEIAAESPAIPDSPGVVTFDTPTVVAGSSQPLVAITLRRLQSTQGAAAVEWRLESGSAQPDVDYERMRPQIVRFFEGQSVRTVFVPLLSTGASVAARTPRTFSVVLQKLSGGPALGSIARVAVTINPSGAIN